MSQKFYQQVVDEHLTEVLEAFKAGKITSETAKGKILKAFEYARNKFKDEDSSGHHHPDEGTTEGDSVQSSM